MKCSFILRFCLLFTLLFSLRNLNGQVPQSFNYQAVAREAGGKVITGQLSVRFKLHEDHAAGTTRYAETHTVTTNDQGIFSLQVGRGTIVSGNMDLIDWAKHDYFLETQIKTSNDADYVSMGTTQLLSVPYALYAAASGTTLTGGNGIEVQNDVINNTGDLSVTNELQSLSVNGNQLSISDGNSVILPTGTTYTAGTGININNNAISAVDNNATNEIQTLSLNGNQLSLSNGGGAVQLPTGNTSWSTNGNTIYSNPTTSNVAIGSTSSTARLDVASSGNNHAGNFTSPGSGDALHAYCNGTGAGISASSLNGPAAVFSTQGGTAGSFTSSTGTAGYFKSNSGYGLIVEKGKVGIGVTNPFVNLQVEDGYARITGPQNPGDSYGVMTSYAYGGNKCFYGISYGTGPAAHFIASGGLSLLLDGDAGIGTGLKIEFNSSNWNQYIDAAKDLNFAYNGVLKAYIQDTDGSYHQYSDGRLKKDIQPFRDVLQGISNLQAYTYHMRDASADSPLSVGFMAGDVEKVFPQLVVEKDGYKSLCYDQFAVLSIQAIKEQQAQINALENKVTELESVVMEMKAMLEKKN